MVAAVGRAKHGSTPTIGLVQGSPLEEELPPVMMQSAPIWISHGSDCVGCGGVGGGGIGVGGGGGISGGGIGGGSAFSVTVFLSSA